MRQFSAMAASTANSTALRFKTGKAPGNPRQTGQTFVFAGAPKCVEQEQKILVAVRSWTCTSNPITTSYLARAAMELSCVAGITSDYRAWLRLLRWSAQVLLQRNFEVHQFVALGILHACEIKMRAGQRSRNAPARRRT